MNSNGHNHEPSDELLSAYLDGELTDAERAAVEARLAADPEAQHLLHQLRSVSQDVQSLPLKSAPRDLRDQILSRIEKSPLAPKNTAASAPIADARTTTAPLSFQGRRPWIWASLAVAAGLMIMFLNRDNDNREHLAAVSDGPRDRAASREPPLQPELGSTENKPATAVADPTVVAKSETFDAPVAAGIPAAPSAMPPASAAAPAGQVASSGRRLDDSSSISSPAPPLPAPTAAPAPPPQNVGRADNVGALTMPDQLADRQKQPSTSGTFIGGGGALGGKVNDEWQLSERGETQSPTLVVHVVAKKHALDNNAFEDLLAKHHIQLESNATTLAFDASRRAGGAAVRSYKSAEADRFARDSAMKPAAGEQFDFVEVEAPRQSIVACLTELKQDSANYAGVAVDNLTSATEETLNASPASADKKKLGVDIQLYSRGAVPQQQKDAVTNRVDAYRESRGREVPSTAGQSLPASSELATTGRQELSREKRELEQLKEAKIPAADQPPADQLGAEKSSLGRARRVNPTEIQNRSLFRGSASSGPQPSEEDLAKRVPTPVNLRVLFVIGEETTTDPKK